MKLKSFLIAATFLAMTASVQAHDLSDSDLRWCNTQAEAAKAVMMNRQLENNIQKSMAVLSSGDTLGESEEDKYVRSLYVALTLDAYNLEFYPERRQKEAAADGFSQSAMHSCLKTRLDASYTSDDVATRSSSKPKNVNTIKRNK